MQIMEMSLYMQEAVEITQINAGANCYIVTQNESSILIDTGVKGFEQGIKEYDKMIESVRKVQDMGELKIYFGHGKMVYNRKWV